MENKSNEATPQRPEGDRMMDASMVTIDLPTFIKQIKEEQAWKDSDRNAITVFKTDGVSIVLVALHANAELTKHKANGVINLQILEGHIQFKTDERAVELKKGQIVILHGGIHHSVLAREESVFMLTHTSSAAK